MTETTTNDFLRSVAREVIELRASKEGYEPNAYDAEQDPEGYIRSLLNALHQWCNRYGIDWDNELAQAQEFFEQDLAEAQSDAATLPPPTVKDLRCPKCKQETCFVIEVSERLLMFPDGVVLHGETGEEWGDWSHCRCPTCQHVGTIYQFRKAKQTEQEVSTNG